MKYSIIKLLKQTLNKHHKNWFLINLEETIKEIFKSVQGCAKLCQTNILIKSPFMSIADIMGELTDGMRDFTGVINWRIHWLW